MSENTGQGTDNVRVVARRYRVNHKGLHGFVEYLPSSKLWQWVLKLKFTTTQMAQSPTKEQAELDIKKEIDIVADSKYVTSVD